MSNAGSRRAFTRRRVLIGAGGVSIAACAGIPRDAHAVKAIERRLGGRVGLDALDLSTGRRIAYRADERFAMCSTFKWALAGIILQDAEKGALSLATVMQISKKDLVPSAPVVEKRLADGGMRIGELCAAAVSVSDNAAGNLLLRLVGGPAGFTRRLRALGDRATRLDRWEPDLNENAPGDPRDTTTPAAMVELLRIILLGDTLSERSKARLTDWMIGSTRGLERLRAGLPPDWRAGNKPGTGNGAHNDVAFAVPPGRAPIFIACYMNAPKAEAADLDAAHKAIGRLIGSAFA